MYHNTDFSQLVTPRLIIRELRLSDAPAYKDFFDSPKALEFFTELKPGTPSLANEWIERQLNRYKTYGMGLWALVIKETNEVVGQCGLLVQEVDGAQELEIGYNLLPDHWRKGYATEAAQACKAYAFNNKLAPSLISIIDAGNVNSQRVAERNGMQREKQTSYKNLSVYIYRIAAPYSQS